MDKHIILCWVPSHVGIVGNEKPDPAAKSGLNQSVINIRFPSTDLYSGINELYKSKAVVLGQLCFNKLHTNLPFLERKQKHKWAELS